MAACRRPGGKRRLLQHRLLGHVGAATTDLLRFVLREGGQCGDGPADDRPCQRQDRCGGRIDHSGRAGTGRDTTSRLRPQPLRRAPTSIVEFLFRHPKCLVPIYFPVSAHLQKPTKRQTHRPHATPRRSSSGVSAVSRRQLRRGNTSPNATSGKRPSVRLRTGPATDALEISVDRRHRLARILRWCEDLHMEPVLAVFAGYTLQAGHPAGLSGALRPGCGG